MLCDPAFDAVRPTLENSNTLFVSQIKIENFRGIAELEIDLSPSTVLIGANNVGKTTVLAALDVVLGRQTGRGSRFQDYDHRRDDADRDLPDGHEVTITLTFTETNEDPWPIGAAQALNDAIQLAKDGTRHLIVQMRDTYDATSRESSFATSFLNLDGDPLPIKPLERTLRQFSPAFYLPAERSASSDFRSGARFWSPFLRDPSLAPDVRRKLEKRLSEVSSEVMDAAPNLAALRKVLDGSGQLIDLKDEDPVTLEPLPTRLPEVLRRTEVRLTTPAGASVPLDRHGGGTQNVAVLFLFQAYLATTMAAEYEAEALPILAIEEPEAHLHPSATRSAWSILNDMKGQKVIATHSGDLLSLVPLSAVRRLARTDSNIAVYRVKPGTLTANEERKVDFHIRRARGELLFGDVWLLGEGESEYWIFTGAAEGLDIDLEQTGVRVVDCFAQSGSTPLVKVADDLGIRWHCVADGDEQGRRTVKALKKLLHGRPESDHITLLGYRCIEHMLCEEGFGDMYEAALTPTEIAEIAPQSHPNHWVDVAEKIKRTRKVRLAVDIADILRTKERPVPQTLNAILRTALKLKPN